MSGRYIEVEPAYGRDYTSQAQVRADWKAGKDFRDTATGRYVSMREAKSMGLKVTARYDRSRKVMAL